MVRSSRFTQLVFAIITLTDTAVIASAQSPSWQWREIAVAAAGQKPEARRNGVIVYDPVAKRIILFGGAGNCGSLNDTWALQVETGTWSKLATTGPTPATRFAFDAVYDPAGHQMVIYSGQGSGFFNDTWTLNLNTLEWRDVSPASNAARPKARYGSASIFDPVSRSLVQFAGFTSESGRFQDTQSFSLATNAWTDWTPSGNKPQIRCLLTAAFDRANRRMIIYGGQRSGALDDIWSFDLASRTWTNLTPAQRPGGRWFASSFLDKDGRFFIFGGFTSAGNSNELWSFDFSNNQWSKVEPANPPSARNGAMSVFIEAENRLILFGGSSNSGVMNDVWELRQNTSTATVSTPPIVGIATASNATVSLTFAAPANDGGATITGYIATCGSQSAVGAGSPITVTGLTNGVAVTCTVVATNAVGNSAPSAASNSVTPNFTGTAIPRLVNISTRGLAETGDNIMIGGFIIGGSLPKRVVITGRGPFLADFNVPGTMVDPAIRLFANGVEIGSNDDWQSTANAAELTASGFAPTKVVEAAILTTLNPGVPYTVHLTGAANGTGVAIMEVFEVDKPEVPLLNLSTRGRVQTGDNVMIVGFIIQGHGPQEVLITARGPSLGQAPFHVPAVLADPVLDLYQGAAPLDFNDNWGESTRAAAIQATGNAPSNALEAAILRTLQPGAYTAIVRGKNGGLGVGIVEVYAK